MLIFDRCRRSWAAVAPFKYKCDSNNSRGTFGQIENFAYGEINERSFSNPHPRAVPVLTERSGFVAEHSLYVKCLSLPPSPLYALKLYANECIRICICGYSDESLLGADCKDWLCSRAFVYFSDCLILSRAEPYADRTAMAVSVYKNIIYIIDFIYVHWMRSV